MNLKIKKQQSVHESRDYYCLRQRHGTPSIYPAHMPRGAEPNYPEEASGGGQVEIGVERRNEASAAASVGSRDGDRNPMGITNPNPHSSR